MLSDLSICAERLLNGVISPKTAELIDYAYESSGLNYFIASVLNDMNRENKNNEYEFKGIKI